MKCPNCNKEIDIDFVVYRNAERYHNTNLAVSNCCGTAFIVKPVLTLKVTHYTGDKTEDDWGNPIKKTQCQQ